MNGTKGTVYGTHGNFDDPDVTETSDWFRVNLEPGAMYNLSVIGANLNYTDYGALSDVSVYLITAFYASDDVNHSTPRSTQIANDAYGCQLSHRSWSAPYPIRSSFNSVYCNVERFSIDQETAWMTFTASFLMGSENQEYYVMVDGRGKGSYAVTLEELAPAPSGDDHGNDDQSSSLLSIGRTATGRLEQQDDRDRFQVNLTAGQAYLFRLRGLDEGNDGLLRNPALAIHGIHPAINTQIRLGVASRYSNYVDKNGRVANASQLAQVKSRRTDTKVWLYFEPLSTGTHYLDVYELYPVSVPGVGYTVWVSETGIRTE